jgi:hypothetical protein
MVYNKYVNMRFIEALCPPALLYLIFLVVQLGLDLSLGMWVTFVIKLVLGLAVVKVLDTFCGIGLSPVSWFIVAAPFVITALGTAISMGTNFDEIVIISLQGGDTKEKFTDGGSVRQHNPPGAGEPPEPGITPATQSWTEGAMGNPWGNNYSTSWSQSASDDNGAVQLTQMGRKTIQIDFPSAV